MKNGIVNLIFRNKKPLKAGRYEFQITKIILPVGSKIMTCYGKIKKINKSSGASSIEYVLIVSAIIVFVYGLIQFGPAVKSLFDSINSVWPK